MPVVRHDIATKIKPESLSGLKEPPMSNTHIRDFYEPQIFHDHFQNFKRYNIPRAQIVIADVPYNLGKNAYASNPSWCKDGDNRNGESELAGKMFFESDSDFSPAHFMTFCEWGFCQASLQQMWEDESTRREWIQELKRQGELYAVLKTRHLLTSPFRLVGGC